MTTRSTRTRGGGASSGNTPQPEDGLRATQGAGKGKRIVALGKDAFADGEVAADGGHPAAPQRLPIARSEVNFPLELGTLLECRWRDDRYYPARIIERRKNEGDDSEDYDYYVHYRKFNRRMDEWVTVDNFNLDTVVPPEPADPNDKSRSKRKADEEHSEEEGEGHENFDAQALREHEEFTKVKNIERIELGRYEMETWYFSPFPPEYKDCKKLYFSEYDLAFFKRRDQMLRHLKKCRLLHPPGTEIYRNGGISMFEIDGRKAKTYCQNLCYLAKLFLDHKTLYYDVDFFLFYVMCECDERGAHVCGYFSKEKFSEEGFNLACILTLPAYQRKGYGKFLISFSYELSKIENKVGTPERPLSDLGLVSYRGYWTRVLLSILKDCEGSISIKDLSERTMIKIDDIISTLQHLNLIQYQKGQHVICAAPHVVEAHLRKCGSPGLIVDPSKIVWTPFDGDIAAHISKQ